MQSALVQEMDQVIQAAAENEIETMEGDGPSCEECQALYNLGYVDNCDAACGGG